MKHIILIFLFLVTMISPVYAYMDPGSLTILLQVIVSGVVGAVVYIKLFSHKIKNYFTKILTKFKKQEKK